MKTTLTPLLERYRQTSRLVKLIIWFFISYASYALLVGLLLPAIIQSQAPKQMTEALGRNVKISEVRINPFILRVQVNDFEIAEENKTDTFIAFKQLETEFNFWESIINLTPALEYFTLKQPDINLIHISSEKDETLFNFSSILTHLAQQSENQPNQPEQESRETENTQIFAFIAHSIQLEKGRVNFYDQPVKAQLGYENINFSLNELNTRALTLSQPETSDKTEPLNTAANLYSLAMEGIDKSLLNIAGQFQLQPLEVDGDIKLSHLKLLPFWPFAEDLIEAKLTSGEINFASDYHLMEKGDQVIADTSAGSFSLNGVSFADKESAKLKLEKLGVTGIALNTDTQIIDIEKVAFSGLWADARISDKGLNLQRLFTPKAEDQQAESKPVTESQTASEESGADKPDEKAWLVQLAAFEMLETDFHMEEALVSNGIHWRVYPFNFTTGSILSDLSKPIDYTLSLGISSDEKNKPEKRRGELTTSGKVDAKSLEVDGKLQLTALDLTQLQPYLEPYLNIEFNKGFFSTSANYSADSKGKLLYQGQADIADLLIKDVVEYEPLLKWKKMSLDSMDFDLADQSLKIKTITLDAPYAKVLIAKDKRTNIGEISKSEESPEQTEDSAPDTDKKVTENETEETQTASTESEFKLDIDKILIKDGSAFFADYSLTPNFASGIELLNGYIDHISSTPGTKAEIDITGQIDRYAPVSLKGEVNPLVNPPYLDMDFKMKSVELTSVNPYSGTYAGYYIDKGQLSMDINYQLEDNQLQGKNHIVVDQLTLGQKSDSDLATALPITLAIGLLKDRHGVIDIGFGVDGDVNSPDFSFGGAILNAVVNLITKAVTAPFSMLADLVGGGDEELNMVEFAFGEAALDDDATDKMTKLANALQERPGLKLSIEGSVMSLDDSRAMAEARVQEKLVAGSGAPLPEDLTASRIPASGPLTSALETLFVQELKKDIETERTKVELMITESGEVTEVTPEEVTARLHIGMYNQLINSQEITKGDLGNLAQSRARAVKAFLVTNGVEPERVFILDSKTELKTDKSQSLLTIDSN